MTEQTTDHPTRRRAAIIYNPVKVELDELKASVAEAEERGGYAESVWYETTKADPGVQMARDAVSDGVDLVVVAGGDGTVRAVVEGVRGSSCSLGLLPSGTGNLLARNLNLTLDDMPDSVITAFDGVDRGVDLGMADMVRADGSEESKPFLVMAGLGLDAQMIVNTDEDLKAKAGWLAYGKALVKSMRGGSRIRLRYAVDGNAPRTARVHTLVVGNCGSLPANILLLPDAAVDDGVLDIVALRPDGPLGWLQIWSRILVEHAILRRAEVGQRLTSDTKRIRALRYLRGAQIAIQLSAPEEFELDGDTEGEVERVTIRVEKHGLRIRVPRDS